MSDEQTEIHQKNMFNASAAKVFDVLNLFEVLGPSLSLTQVSKHGKLSIGSSQRALYTLQLLGYIERDIENKLYNLTPKVLALGYSFTKKNALIDRAALVMHELHNAIGETINLTTIFESEVIILARRVSRFLINNQVGVGARIPVFCTASGLAHLSALDRKVAAEILGKTPRTKLTPRTEVRLDAILNRLKHIREAGYVITYEEVYIGDATISAPIFELGQPVGSLTIAVPTSRWKLEDMQKKLAPPLIAAVRAISR